MRSFLDRIYGPQLRQDGRTYSTPGDQIRYEDLAAAYLSADRDHANDIIQAIGSSTAALKTVHMRVAAILEFLAHHGAQTSDRDRRQTRQKLPIGRPISKRGELSHEIIRNIVGHTNEHMRALILVLASSGMRIGEAVSIRLADLDLDASPPTVEINVDYSALLVTPALGGTPGEVKACGFDGVGQVSQTPAETGFVAVAAGHYHSLALKADGSIVSWGWNDYGQVS